jgi:hypothetical protein
MAGGCQFSSPTNVLLSGAGAVKSVPTPLLVAYSVFLLGSFGLYHVVMSDGLSAILTVAEMFQCLAVGLLAAQVLITGSVAGISARALSLHAIGLCLRLSSTLWLNGYLPVCDSGDWLFQTVDLIALAVELWLLYQMWVVRRHTYQADADTFPIVPVFVGAYVLAAVFHADMNLRPIFDTNWMAGLFLCNVAVLPQLWLINHTGGKVEALTSHHIASMAVGTILGGVFMYHAREDITCQFWIEDVNHAVLAILSAYLVHLLLLSDFAYFYFKAVATQGLACQLDLESVCSFV